MGQPNASAVESVVQQAAQPWLIAGVWWFVVIAAIGTIMRGVLAIGFSLPLPFQYLLHAHSHVAFFGWMGSILMGMYYSLLPILTGISPARRWGTSLHFWLLQVLSAGALVSFLAQGYGVFSIILSTCHLFLWYYFAWRLRTQFRSEQVRSSPVLLLMKLSVGMLVLSSLGTWSLPYVVINAADTVFLKQMSVDFFVHTFADGWLLSGVLAVVLLAVRAKLPSNRLPQFRFNLALSIPAIILSSIRSVAVEFPVPVQMVVLGAGVVLGVLHLHMIWLFRESLQRLGFRLFAVFLVVKVAMEFIPILPGGTELMANRLLLVAYLHTKLLGIASVGIVVVLNALFPAPWERKHAFPLLFGYSSAFMVCCLVLTGAPALAHWIGVQRDMSVLVSIGHYGALVASLLLLVLGAALLLYRIRAVQPHAPSAAILSVLHSKVQHTILWSNQKGEQYGIDTKR